MSAFTSKGGNRGRCLAMAAAAAAVLSGCLENPLGSSTYLQATATTGKTYNGSGANNADFSDAAQASGAHDIPCPITKVTAHWVKEHEWVAEGCGERIDYVAKHKFAVPWVLTVSSRTKLPAAATPAAASAPVAATGVAPVALPPPAPTAGCSKDTDCKGARICVNAACVDPPPRPVD